MVRLALESCTAQGFEGFEPSGKLGMIWRWANSDGCRTRIASPGCARRQQCVGCLAIRRRGSWCCCGGEKNGVWHLWTMAPQFLRQTATVGAGPVVRRRAHLPGRGGTPGGVPELRDSEARAAGEVGRQSLLQQAVCILRGASVPGGDDLGCSQGAAPGLGLGQNAGEAVHARAVATRGHPRAQRYWDRRDLDPRGPLFHRNPMVDPASADPFVR